jgi:5-methylcytosine-specific restriction endonuclease McrA
MVNRTPLSKSLQVEVFRRDGWLCHLCKRPVIFAPVMRLLEREVRMAGNGKRLAYYNARWTREGAPLLDLLAGVIDHVKAFARGGASDTGNLATACCKCNAQKSHATRDQYLARSIKKSVKGKYGEPQNWDGLSLLFVALAQRDLTALTTSEKGWLRALA